MTSPSPRRPRRWPGRFTALPAAAALLLLTGADRHDAGAAVADGRVPLAARIAGHAQVLPPAAARCGNCHAGTQAIGGPLDAAHLARPVARRGGPPSRYDADALCRLLRTGIDPAWVMVDRAMPRFEISDVQCRALWDHLAS